MFGIVDNRRDQCMTALYFKEYPQLPLKESGTRFKFKDETINTKMQDIVPMLGNRSTQKTITTDYKVDFKIESYVLIGNTLYRIINIDSAIENIQTTRIVKCPKVKQTLLLNRVSNALNLEI